MSKQYQMKFPTLLPRHTRPAVISLIASLSFIYAPSLSAFTSGAGIERNPFIIDSSDTVLNWGCYYTANTSIKFADNSAWFIGYSAPDNHLVITGDSTTVSNRIGYIAYDTNSKADVVVRGSGAKWNNQYLVVGYHGDASLAIIDGGQVYAGKDGCDIGMYSLGKSSMTISGNGSSFTTPSVTAVGFNNRYGTAQLIIEHGGTFSCANCFIGGTDSIEDCYAQGALTLNGENSSMTSSGDLYVGWCSSGYGSVTVSDGAVLNVMRCEVDNGVVQIYGASSSMINANDLCVGYTHPGHASVVVSDGAIVNNSNCYVDIGELNITGVGSSMTNSATLYLGRYATSGGLITISNGAIMKNQLCTVENGTLVISGEGSSMVNTHDIMVSLAKEADEEATMRIDDGGTVSTESLVIGTGMITKSVDNTSANVTSAKGSLIIDGDGSSLHATGPLYFGKNGGTAIITIKNGGSIASDDVCTIGSDVNPLLRPTITTSGTMHISGAKSQLQVDSIEIAVGAATGLLKIDDGCSVTITPKLSDTACEVAAKQYTGATGGHGEIIIDQKGSCLITDGVVVLGGEGTGYLTISNEALACFGWVGKDLITRDGGAIRLADGYFAIRGRNTAQSILDSGLKLQVYKGKQWATATANDLTVIYYDKKTNIWAQSDLYAAYGDKMDLTGYTVIHSGTNIVLDAPKWLDADKGADGWYHSSWYGWVSIKASDNGWAYHANHGWEYIQDLGGDVGIVTWDIAAQSWWFTSKAFYPYMYNYDMKSWYYYYVGGVTPNRWFYNYTDNKAVKESDEF